MSDIQSERLYHLIPAIYRLRDTQQGEPLRALMAVLQSQVLNLQADMEALYDNWFIETADDWVVPYLADLVGITDLSLPTVTPFSQRRRVANTLAYRRRKGTMATLEHILQDVTGWGVRVLELGTLVAATQHLAHVRRDNRLVDLRREVILTRLDGPFDRMAHSVDVSDLTQDPTRQQSMLRGKYRPDHLGVYVWRLNSYPVYNSPAYPVRRGSAGGRRLPAGCYTFDPLGRDLQLFNQPIELKQITSRVMPVHLPLAITREILVEDLDSHHSNPQAHPDWPAPLNSLYYGPDRSILITIDDNPVPPAAVVCADLSRWQAPVNVAAPAAEAAPWAAVDPVLGRFILLDGKRPARARVEVSYNYGFSADLGGGSYPRFLSLIQPDPETFQVDLAAGSQVDTLKKALETWEAVSDSQRRCLVNVLDSGLYEEDGLTIHLPKNGRLTIQAVDGARPVFRFKESLIVDNRMSGASLSLNGLLIDGKIEIAAGIQLSVLHSTLMPHGIRGLADAVDLTALQVSIDSSICGPIRLPADIQGLDVTNSLLDHAGGYAISGPVEGSAGPLSSFQKVTVFGQVRLAEISQASATIFNDPVHVAESQKGQVSYCYLAAGSQTPPRDHCLAGEMDHVVPVFTSTHYGDPGYAQLSQKAAAAISRGAEDGAEMGVFHDLYNSQRQDNLSGQNTSILDDYLPFGMLPGIFYVT